MIIKINFAPQSCDMIKNNKQYDVTPLWHDNIHKIGNGIALLRQGFLIKKVYLKKEVMLSHKSAIWLIK